MTEAASTASGLLTIRSLRRNPALAPGGEHNWVFLRRFMPMVHGIAVALVPENAAVAEEVTIAVFEAFAARWRRLSQKTFVAVWLLRSTLFAVARERSRVGLPARAGTPAGVLAQFLFKRLIRLKPFRSTPIIFRFLLDEQPEQIGAAMGKKPGKTEKWTAAGLAKLAKPVMTRAKKLGLLPTQPSELLRATPSLLVDDRFVAMAKRILEVSAQKKPTPLAASTLNDWAWLNFFRFVKGFAKFAGSAVATIVLSISTFVFLIQSGRLNPPTWVFTAGQGNMAKKFPGMVQPARPWPVSEEDQTRVPSAFPKTSAELYGMTNIWTAKIQFTEKQWRGVQPMRIKQERMSQGGRMVLRNPNASRSGLAGVVGFDFPWSEATFEFAGKKFQKAGVRIRGNGTYLQSLWGNKQSYKVDLNRNIKKQSVGGVDQLNFVNSIPDFSYVKDALAQKLFRELGAVAPRTAYAYMTVDAPGKLKNQPLGLYVMVEDIGPDFAKDRFGVKTAPIFKPVTYDLFLDWGNQWKDYADIYDLKTKANDQQTARVVEFAKLVSHAGDEEFARRLPEFLDLEEYAAFVAGHVLLSSYDGYLNNGQNFYVYLDPRSNKFGFIPWDQDHGWGEFGYVGRAEQRENANIWKPSTYDNKFLKRVMKVEAFAKVYRNKLEEALAGPFTVDRLNAEIDSLAAVIRPAVAAESDFRLERFETAISTNWVAGPRDGAGGMDTMEGPGAPAHQLKRFILARTQSIRDQLDGKSEGHLMGRR